MAKSGSEQVDTRGRSGNVAALGAVIAGHGKPDQWLLVIRLFAVVILLCGALFALIAAIFNATAFAPTSQNTIGNQWGLHLMTGLLGIGSSLVAAGLATLLLSSAEKRSREADFSKLHQQFQETRDTVRQLAFAELVSDASGLYEKATNIVESTEEGSILSTDFRIFPRFAPDVEFQRDYLLSLGKHLSRKRENKRPVQFLRAVAAGSKEDAEVLCSQTSEAFGDHMKSGLARLKFYPHVPLVFDVLIGQGSVLLAFPEREREPRIGIVLWNQRVAECLREWYANTIWESPHLERCKEVHERLNGCTPCNIETVEKLQEICTKLGPPE